MGDLSAWLRSECDMYRKQAEDLHLKVSTALAEVSRLSSENERLEAALRHAVDITHGFCFEDESVPSSKRVEIIVAEAKARAARQALEPKP